MGGLSGGAKDELIALLESYGVSWHENRQDVDEIAEEILNLVDRWIAEEPDDGV